MSSEVKRQPLSSTTLIATAAGIGLVYMIFRNKSISNKIKMLCNFRDPLNYQTVKIIETQEECKEIISHLISHCKEYKVLGFDCEWVTVGKSRRPVALLQLASYKGLCALIRLCNLKNIPQSLRELLENEEILKVGVATHDDAGRLAYDYGVGVASTFDLRFLAIRAKRKPEGLAKLSKSILNIELDKNWRIRCSDWEAKELTNVQIDYAAKDAIVAVEIFMKLAKEIYPSYFWQSAKFRWQNICKICEPFLDRKFKDSMISTIEQQIKNSTQVVNKNKTSSIKKPLSRNMCTRSKSLYDNCLLQAPDGELLCTCDRKKAQWYIDQNLGELITSDPFTVRLNFEPAGRAVGEVGKYYTTVKINQCVVCGTQDAYIRKNVVPREYRKHFPVVMKSHTSHDVLLLCPPCHQISNMSDLKVRVKLSKMCNAPLTNEEGGAKFIEVPRLRQLRSAARALLYNSNHIPETRKKDLENVVLQNMKNCTKITTEVLQEAANIDVIEYVDTYCSHGFKVVEEFKTKLGGLVELERMWREHFLIIMQPKFLPELWSINHNANRLEIRATEGRIDKDDMTLAGIICPLESSEREFYEQSNFSLEKNNPNL